MGVSPSYQHLLLRLLLYFALDYHTAVDSSALSASLTDRAAAQDDRCLLSLSRCRVLFCVEADSKQCGREEGWAALLLVFCRNG